MSDLPFDPSQVGADPGAQGGGAGQPSEEEVRQYLAQMRSAPVEQVVAEVLQGLLNAAQVKLGRRDGRLLLDTAGAIMDQARAHLSAQLAKQVDDALSQLKLAQVQAEKEVADSGVDEPNDLAGAGSGAASAPAPGAGDSPAGAGQPAGQQAPPGESPLNKLWIPGR